MNWLGFANCRAAQLAKLQEAGNFLSDRICEEGGWRMYQCLDDAFLSNVNGHRTASEILDQLRTPGQTIIECTDSFHDRCGGGHEWLGCAYVGISGERLEIANHFLLDPNVSEAAIAGVIAHEIAHNRGHNHNGLGPGEYDLTATQQVRACVSNLSPSGEPDPFGPRRSSIPVEVELGPAGHMGGSPLRTSLLWKHVRKWPATRPRFGGGQPSAPVYKRANIGARRQCVPPAGCGPRRPS
jgi:hypothetical protein